MLKEKLEKWSKTIEKLKKAEMESTKAFNTLIEQKVSSNQIKKKIMILIFILFLSLKFFQI